MAAQWQHDNFTLDVGYAYYNVLTVARPESAGYATTGHSAVFRLKNLDGQSDLIAKSMPVVGVPALQTVGGVANTFVIAFELSLTAAEIGALTAGETYSYVVDVLDSRVQTRPEAEGRVYARRVA